MTDNNKEVDDDASEARENLKELISTGNESLAGLSQLASDMEHPRAYEVLGGMLKTLADMNGQLLDLQKKKKDIKKVDQPKLGELPNGDGGVTNNLFVGSTTDLQKMLSGINDEKTIDVDVNDD